MELQADSLSIGRGSVKVPIERTQPARFNVEVQRPYFSLEMTFSNAVEVRKSISKYFISR